jgi:hypothetical protein
MKGDFKIQLTEAKNGINMYIDKALMCPRCYKQLREILPIIFYKCIVQLLCAVCMYSLLLQSFQNTNALRIISQ